MSRVDDLYARFEDRFRGPREQIMERLANYGPLLSLLEVRIDQRNALDCGCGRGEWLEMLGARSWNAQGVDLNERMLEQARQHGAQVVHADVIAHLASVPSGSKQLVTAFHLVEHLPIESLLTMLTEFARIVAVNGLVILETPNAENLTVGTSQFYLDPTHRNPLPPDLLQFYLTDCGFEHARILRINGETRPAVGGSLESAIRPLLFRALDYAVIGTRSDDLAYRESIAHYVSRYGERAPTELDRLSALDVSLAQERQADLRGREIEAQGLMASIGETKSALHASIDAVYNAVQQMSARLEALEDRLHKAAATDEQHAVDLDALRGAGMQLVARAEAVERSLGALHEGIVSSSRVQDALQARLVVHLEELGVNATVVAHSQARLAGRLDELVAGIKAAEQTQEAFLRGNREMATGLGTQLDGLRTTMRQALTNARKASDAREYRIVTALETTRRTSIELATSRKARDGETEAQTAAQELANAVQEAEARVAAAYQSTTSWRVTRPMRQVLGWINGQRQAPSTRQKQPRVAITRAMVSNPIVWHVGKNIARVVPGLRLRLLQRLNQKNLLDSPLAEDFSMLPATAAVEEMPAFGMLLEPEEVEVALMPAERRRLFNRLVDAQATVIREGR